MMQTALPCRHPVRRGSRPKALGRAKAKGPKALEGLHQFLKDAGIPFLPLHSDFATWPAAAETVLDLLQGRSAENP